MTEEEFNFNSIKVRLEQVADGVYDAGKPFQFHKGAIRTILYTLLYIEKIIFQFHKGAIRTFMRCA